VIEDFASEHQQQVDVQLEMESRNLSKPVGPALNNDDSDQPSASGGDGEANIDVEGEQDTEETAEEELVEVAELEEALDGSTSSDNAQQSQSPDLPKPGDTLH